MALPQAPSRSMDQTTFDNTTDAFVGALPQFETDMNALAAAMSLNSTIDTSSTSNSIAPGSKTFTVTAGKSFVGGMWLVIADTAAPSTNSMIGQITSYSGTTLVINVTNILGSGTKTAWIISQHAGGDAAVNTWTPAVAGVALSTVTAKYSKTGDTVIVQAKFDTDATTGAGVFTVTGLPFVASQTAVGVCFPNNAAVLASRIEAGQSSITFYYYSTAVQATITQCASTTFVVSIEIIV